MKKEGFFTNAQEMIDYILSGKRIVADDDPNEFFQLRDGKVFHKYLEYNDIDMPIGYSGKYESIEEFKNWVARCEKNQIMEHKPFVNYFFKKETIGQIRFPEIKISEDHILCSILLQIQLVLFHLRKRLRHLLFLRHS